MQQPSGRRGPKGPPTKAPTPGLTGKRRRPRYAIWGFGSRRLPMAGLQLLAAVAVHLLGTQGPATATEHRAAPRQSRRGGHVPLTLLMLKRLRRAHCKELKLRMQSVRIAAAPQGVNKTLGSGVPPALPYSGIAVASCGDVGFRPREKMHKSQDPCYLKRQRGSSSRLDVNSRAWPARDRILWRKHKRKVCKRRIIIIRQKNLRK